jgi:hypothetical protein
MFRCNEWAATAIAAVALFSFMALTNWSDNAVVAAKATSCNNLKAAAIAASQPVPRCYGE